MIHKHWSHTPHDCNIRHSPAPLNCFRISLARALVSGCTLRGRPHWVTATCHESLRRTSVLKAFLVVVAERQRLFTTLTTYLWSFHHILCQTCSPTAPSSQAVLFQVALCLQKVGHSCLNLWGRLPEELFFQRRLGVSSAKATNSDTSQCTSLITNLPCYLYEISSQL